MMRRLSRSHTTSSTPPMDKTSSGNSSLSGPGTPSSSRPAGSASRRRLSLQPISSSGSGLRTPKLSPSFPNSASTAVTTKTTTIKIMVLGAGKAKLRWELAKVATRFLAGFFLKVGKTTVISSFLRSSPPTKYTKTVEEYHVAEFRISSPGGGVEKLVLEILDTAGSFEFPAMRNLNILNSDAFLVLWGGEAEGAGEEEALHLLDQVLKTKGSNSPILLLQNEFGGRTLEFSAGRVPGSVLRLSANCYHNVDHVFQTLLRAGGWIGPSTDLGKCRVPGAGHQGRRTSLPSSTENKSGGSSGSGAVSAPGTVAVEDNRNSCTVS